MVWYGMVHLTNAPVATTDELETMRYVNWTDISLKLFNSLAITTMQYYMYRTSDAQILNTNDTCALVLNHLLRLSLFVHLQPFHLLACLHCQVAVILAASLLNLAPQTQLLLKVPHAIKRFIHWNNYSYIKLFLCRHQHYLINHGHLSFTINSITTTLSCRL